MKGRFLLYCFSFITLGLFAQIEPDTTVINKSNDLHYGFYLLETENIKEAEVSFQKYIKSLPTSEERRKACYEIALNYNNKLYNNLSISYAQEGIDDKDEDAYLMKEGELCNEICFRVTHLNRNTLNFSKS